MWDRGFVFSFSNASANHFVKGVALQSNGVHFFYATNKSWFLFYVFLGQVFNVSLCVG